MVWWRKGVEFSVHQPQEGGVYGARLWRGGMLCYSPSSLGKAAWPCREAGSLRGLSAASYRLRAISCVISRHSALFPSADAVCKLAQHVREVEGMNAKIRASPYMQAQTAP